MSGFAITLVDGTVTQLRFRRVGAGLQPETRAANWDVPIPEDMDLQSLVTRVLEYFKDSHEVVSWKDAARLSFKGFQTVFDAQCAARDDCNERLEARLGASPWHLAMLAVGLVVLEIAVSDAKLEHGIACAEERHVLRAYDALLIFHGVRTANANDRHGSLAQPGRPRHCCKKGSTPAALGGRHGFDDFPLTQREPPARESGAQPEAIAAPAGEQPQDPHEVGRFDDQMESQCNLAFEETETGARPGAAAKFLLKNDPEVPKMNVGYGVAGASVQLGDTSEIICTDREIMKNTLMRGRRRGATVHCSDVCDSLRKQKTCHPGAPDGIKRTVALKQQHWKAVMEASFLQYCVGTHEDGADAQTRPRQARLHFSLPSTDSDESQVAFHNRLMLLCQVFLQSFSEAVGLVPPRQLDAELLAATPPAHLEARQEGAEVGAQALEKAPASAAQPHHTRREPHRFQALPVSRDDAQHRSLGASRVKGRSTPPPARRVNVFDLHQD